MTPERENRGRHKTLRHETSASPLRLDPKGKAPAKAEVKAKIGPSWKKTATRSAKDQPKAAPEGAASIEREIPLADTDQGQGETVTQEVTAVPAQPKPATPPKWKAKAALSSGALPSPREKAAVDTSGQIVPKSPYRESSTQAPPSDKLHERESVLRQEPGTSFRQEAQAPASGIASATDSPTMSPELRKAKERLEKRGGKLETAKDKLARQKPIKPPGPVKRAAGFAGRSLHTYVHGKIYESEYENVGVEGAHRAEVVGEAVGRSAVRSVKRTVRQHPTKRVYRAEARYSKAKAEQRFQQARMEHPSLTHDKGVLARIWRKRRLKQQYQRQAQKAGAKAAKGTATVTEKMGQGVAGFVRRHPGGSAIAVLAVLLLVVLQSCVSSLATLGNGTAGGIAASTYPAEDVDLTGAEAAYTALEGQLQDYLDSYTSTHSYDEYHFDLDGIEHDPYVLLSSVSALQDGAWTLADVEPTLQTLFDRQYILTENVVRETRYDTETRTDAEGNEYEVDVPYSYYICTVTLENFNLSHVPVYIMSQDQLSRYALYMAALGNRPDLFPASDYVDKYINHPPVPHEVPEDYRAAPTFAAMLAEAEKYLGYPYVWGGSSPATSFDCSGFVSWVANQSGWDIGRLGATGLYNRCTRVTTPRPGDIVFFTGTFDAPGVTHCGLYVGDGWMLHCGDPIQYADLSSSYWQSHFYAYGRLP